MSQINQLKDQPFAVLEDFYFENEEDLNENEMGELLHLMTERAWVKGDATFNTHPIGRLQMVIEKRLERNELQLGFNLFGELQRKYQSSEDKGKLEDILNGLDWLGDDNEDIQEWIEDRLVSLSSNSNDEDATSKHPLFGQLEKVFRSNSKQLTLKAITRADVNLDILNISGDELFVDAEVKLFANSKSYLYIKLDETLTTAHQLVHRLKQVVDATKLGNIDGGVIHLVLKGQVKKEIEIILDQYKTGHINIQGQFDKSISEEVIDYDFTILAESFLVCSTLK